MNNELLLNFVIKDIGKRIQLIIYSIFKILKVFTKLIHIHKISDVNGTRTTLVKVQLLLCINNFEQIQEKTTVTCSTLSFKIKKKTKPVGFSVPLSTSL